MMNEPDQRQLFITQWNHLFDNQPNPAFMYFMQYTLVYLRPCYKKVQMINCIVTANLLALNSIQDTISFKYSRDQHRRRLSQTRNLDHSCFRRNYSFLNLALCTVTFAYSTYRCGNYSGEEIIQGRKLFAEIRYLAHRTMEWSEA